MIQHFKLQVRSNSQRSTYLPLLNAAIEGRKRKRTCISNKTNPRSCSTEKSFRCYKASIGYDKERPEAICDYFLSLNTVGRFLRSIVKLSPNLVKNNPSVMSAIK